MLFDQLKAILDTPHKGAYFHAQRLIDSLGRLLFLRALIETGIAPLLREPRSADALAEALGAERANEVLSCLLALGVSIGELRESGGRYQLKGRLACAFGEESGGPLAAMILEATSYHVDAFRHLPAQLVGAESRDFLPEYAEIVAESSRTLQPFLEIFAESIAGTDTALRILEIGCGSGVYIQSYAALHAGHRGFAIDLDDAVARTARNRFHTWGVSDRFEVLCEDIRRPSPALDGPFDLVTSFQNIYYFDAEERQSLFETVLHRLAPGGRFAIASMFHSDQALSHYFSLVLSSTAGCSALVPVEVICDELRDAGFAAVEKRRLIPGMPVWGVIGAQT